MIIRKSQLKKIVEIILNCVFAISLLTFAVIDIPVSIKIPIIILQLFTIGFLLDSCLRLNVVIRKIGNVIILNGYNGSFYFSLSDISSVQYQYTYWGRIFDFQILIITSFGGKTTKIFLPLSHNYKNTVKYILEKN